MNKQDQETNKKSQRETTEQWVPARKRGEEEIENSKELQINSNREREI